MVNSYVADDDSINVINNTSYDADGKTINFSNVDLSGDLIVNNDLTMNADTTIVSLSNTNGSKGTSGDYNITNKVNMNATAKTLTISNDDLGSDTGSAVKINNSVTMNATAKSVTISNVDATEDAKKVTNSLTMNATSKSIVLENNDATSPGLINKISLNETAGEILLSQAGVENPTKPANKIKMAGAGGITIDATKDDDAGIVELIAKTDTARVLINKDGVTVTGTTINVVSNDIKLGENAAKTVAMAKAVADKIAALEGAFDKHTHLGNMGAPTGTPATGVPATPTFSPQTKEDDLKSKNVLAL